MRNLSSLCGRNFSASWAFKGDYIGIGHCVIGYPDEHPEASPQERTHLYVGKEKDNG